MKYAAKLSLIALALSFTLLGQSSTDPILGTQSVQAPADSQRIAITFTGGYETDPRDHGRPVNLIAAALGVPADVFREAFSRVTPAVGLREPDPVQVRRNKAALLHALEKYGVTNRRLDEVSDYYRYNGSKGERWPNSSAAAYAVIRDGVVTSIVITNAGAGYNSAPAVSLEGLPNLEIIATLTFVQDEAINGSIRNLTPADLRRK